MNSKLILVGLVAGMASVALAGDPIIPPLPVPIPPTDPVFDGTSGYNRSDEKPFNPNDLVPKPTPQD
jgi:hypothetical protein